MFLLEKFFLLKVIILFFEIIYVNLNVNLLLSKFPQKGIKLMKINFIFQYITQILRLIFITISELDVWNDFISPHKESQLALPINKDLSEC